MKLSNITSSSEHRSDSAGRTQAAAAANSEASMASNSSGTVSASDNASPPAMGMTGPAAAAAPPPPQPPPLAVPADAAAAASAAGVPDRCVISGSSLFSSCSREISGAQMHFNITVDVIKPQNYSQILIDRNISRTQVVDYLKRALAQPSGSCCR